MNDSLKVLAAMMVLSLASADAAEMVPESAVVRLPAKDPTVSLCIWFKVGSQNDPPGKEGLAALTASMLTDAATKANSYERILDLLFPMAGQYVAAVDAEMTVVAGRIHKDNLPDYYRLFTEAILQPAFKQEDLDRLKAQTLNYLENTLRYANDEELGKAVLYNTVFAGTPYGHLAEGTISSVKGITLDDVRAFYQKHYTRENVVIGIGGGFDEKLVEQLRADLARLPAGAPPAVPVSRPRTFEGLHVTIVEKDAQATAISFGAPIDVLRGQPDWYPLALANSWLGEHRNSSSHLYQVIRELRGLNYGDYSYIEFFPNGGQRQMPPQNVGRRQQLCEVWIRPVPNDARVFALRAALREVHRLVDQGMTEDEFNQTRNFLRKYVLHYAPTTLERLGYALDDRFYGIDGSHLEIFHRRMQTVSLAEVQAAVKKHLQYANLQIVFVTPDAAALVKQLTSNAPSPIKYPTPKSEAIVKEDEAIATFPLQIKPENVRVVRVEDLFQ